VNHALGVSTPRAGELKASGQRERSKNGRAGPSLRSAAWRMRVIQYSLTYLRLLDAPHLRGM